MAALASSHLRVARPTNNLDALLRFYRDGLGFHVLFEFKEHEGFDGIMLGHPNTHYHLEFTVCRGHDSGRAPTQDNLLVFYVPENDKFKEAIDSMEKAGFSPVEAFNPYWDGCGKTYEDPDGYRVVLANPVVAVNRSIGNSFQGV